MKRTFRKWLELMRAEREPYPKLALGLADLQVAFEAGWEARKEAETTETTKTIA